MYNQIEVRDALLSVVGWRQRMDAGLTQLLELTTSDSGSYYQEFHALLDLGTIESTTPIFSLMTFNGYSPIVTYAKDDLVGDGVDWYRSLVDANSGNPVNDVTKWVPTNPFTHWLRNKTTAGIYYAINQWILTKFDRKSVRNLLEGNVLLKTTGSIADVIEPTSKNVGMVIVPSRSTNLKTQVLQVAVQFLLTDTITLYLFKSGTVAPVQTEVVTYSVATQVQWVSVTDWYLEPEGSYYLVYDETTLAVGNKAINGLKEHSFNDVDYYPSGRYFDVASFYTTESIATLWDVNQNSITLDSNYGLNLKMSVKCDYTDFIIENKLLFAPLLGDAVALKILEELSVNAHAVVNREQKNAQIQAPVILYEKEGSDERPGGLRKQFQETLAMLSFDMVGLDPVCLPCKKNGVWHGVFK